MPITDPADRRGTNVMLWIAQVLLAALFIFAGGSKLVLPTAALTQQSHVPGLFFRFVGVLELLGGLGMILPWLLRLNPALTPLAAAGLIAVMCGAFGTVIATMGMVPVLLSTVVAGLLAAFVLYGRWRIVPLRVRGQGRAGPVIARPVV
jgi:uncharacterized membrane protein YphA (DoxX/SURF4 family)